MKYLLPLLASILYINPLVAQNSSSNLTDYIIEHWSTDDGLPVNYITSLVQSRDGYIWIGTSAGLLRFDGTSFREYSQQDFDGWTDSWIGPLTETPDSVLWVRSNKGHLAQIKDGEVIRTQFHEWDKTIYLQQSEAGHLYLLTNKGIFVQNAFSSTFRKLHMDGPLPLQIQHAHSADHGIEYISAVPGLYTTSPLDSVLHPVSGFENEYMRSTKTLSDGRLWIAAGSSFGYMNNGVFTQTMDASELHQEYVQVPFIETKDNQLLFLGENKIYTYAENESKPFLSIATRHTGESIRSVTQTHSGSLFISLTNGFVGSIVEYKNGDFQELKIDDDEIIVNCTLEDHEGNLWLGTTHGVYSLKPRNFKVYTKTNGLPTNQVFTVEADEKDNIWVGTWGEGIAEINGDKISHYPLPQDSANYIRASLLEDESSIWFGSPYALSSFKDDRLVDTFLTPRIAQAREWIHSISKDSTNTIYIATNKGLRKLVKDQIVNVPLPHKYKRLLGYSLLETSDQTLWLTTDLGLFKRMGGEWRYINQNASFNYTDLTGIFEDKQGRVWMGTRGQGILIFQQDNISVIDQQQGLSSNIVHAIIEDDQGDFWVTHENGVSRIGGSSIDQVLAGEKKKIESRLFDEKDGLLSSEFSSGTPAVTKSSDGRIWFATLKGVAFVDPKKVRFNDKPPLMQVTNIEVDGQPIRIAKHSEFSHDHNNVKISYAALSYAAPTSNRYRYRLIGKEDRWQEVTFDTEVRYTNLTPGSYEFKVLGTNNNGVWSEKPATFTFIITPPFYAQWWFRGILVIGLIGAIQYARSRNQERQRLRLENAKSAERARISSDIHEGVKSKVNSVKLLLGNLVNDDRFTNRERDILGSNLKNVEHFVRDLKDVIWLLNDKKDTLPELVYKLVEILSKEPFGIRLRFKNEAHYPPIPISPTHRRHIIFVFRELLNNALEHSGCDMITLAVSYDKPVLVIMLEDNGIGFQKEKILKGHGMENVQNRLREIDGALDIESNVGEGTTTTVTINMG